MDTSSSWYCSQDYESNQGWYQSLEYHGIVIKMCDMDPDWTPHSPSSPPPSCPPSYSRHPHPPQQTHSSTAINNQVSWWVSSYKDRRILTDDSLLYGQQQPPLNSWGYLDCPTHFYFVERQWQMTTNKVKLGSHVCLMRAGEAVFAHPTSCHQAISFY